MVCELHFEVKTAILVITINAAPHHCQIVAWYEHGQHCSAATKRLRLCAVMLAQKSKTKLN